MKNTSHHVTEEKPPTDYLYDHREQRRVRFLADGTLEEEYRAPVLGFVPKSSDTLGRALVIWPLVMFGSVALGVALERYGPAKVVLHVVSAIGLLLLLFGAILLQDSHNERDISKRWLWAAVALGASLCASAGALLFRLYDQ